MWTAETKEKILVLHENVKKNFEAQTSRRVGLVQLK